MVQVIWNLRFRGVKSLATQLNHGATSCDGFVVQGPFEGETRFVPQKADPGLKLLVLDLLKKSHPCCVPGDVNWHDVEFMHQGER